MKVQIVAQQAEAALEKMRPDETDLEDLDYQGGEESGGFADTPRSSAPQGKPAEGPVKRRLTYANEPQDDSKMNRADRRRLDKNKRR